MHIYQKTFRLTISYVMWPLLLSAQPDFVFQDQSIAPGTHRMFQLSVTQGTDSTFIPVSVFHGSQPGPVLGITAGVHGYEYAPILAAQEVARKLDPKELSGTIILVHLANVPAFLGRSPYVNPLDQKNLNREFPGQVEGSITEQIADQITRYVIARSDYFLDMHAGDAPEDLRPYVGYYQASRFPEASAKGRQMALAMGFDHIVIFDVANARLDEPSQYCSQEAFHRQIPSVDIECGGLGMASPDDVNRIAEGVFSLLRHLSMLPGEPSQPQSPIIIAERSSVLSPVDGIFYPAKKGGDYVAEGMKVGHVTDFFGRHVADVRANASGVILYIIGTPPIRKEETVLRIGLISGQK